MESNTMTLKNLVKIVDNRTVDFTEFKKFFNGDGFNEKQVDNLELNLKYRDNFYTFKYKKLNLNTNNVETLGLFRSVVFNNYDLLCFAPMKSLTRDDYFKNNTMENSSVEEFVEGTMINCFFDKISKQWEITTKSVVGAETSFSKEENKTFKEMFHEAFQHMNLSWDMFHREYIYSFVLQHPLNKIVCEIKEPSLYLVDVFYVSNTMNSIQVKVIDYRNNESCSSLLQHVKSPKLYEERDFNYIQTKYCSNNTSYDTVGVMIKNGIYRLKIRNPTYEYIHRLKGNNPKMQYQYYSLRKNGRVKEFLKYFPQYKEAFSILRYNLHLITSTLWNNYISCYVNHKAPLRDYGYQYRPHMYALHQLYLNELMEKSKCVSIRVVINYINNLEIPRLMHLVNYNIVKKNIAETVA